MAHPKHTPVKISEAAKDAASKAYDQEVKRANAAATDDLAIPCFLRRQKPKVLIEAILEKQEAERKEAAQLAPTTDMVMLSMYLNEGGHRRFLWVNEGNKIAHLLYVPTMEYIKVDVKEIARQKAIGRATESPVELTLVTILRAKAEQWDRLEKRFSRILVNEALGKLGAAPLPVLEYADEKLPRADGEKPEPRAHKPRTGDTSPRAGGKKDLIRDLLLRPEGCTTADVLAATGWPSVSIPASAKIAGLTLRKEKAPGQPTRYWGSKT